MSVNDYFFIVNEGTQNIEGYSKNESYIYRTLKKKRETKPQNTYTLRHANFGEPIERK